MSTVLSVRDLRVSFEGTEALTPVRGVDLDIEAGEIVGLAGESGSGKTLTTLALTRLLPATATVSATTMDLHGRDLLGSSDRELRQFLGTEVAVVFQDPMSSLNPARRLGPQMAESVRAHRGLSRRAARALAVRHLRELGFSDPERTLRCYPHELSGGMRQRAIIAMGMMSMPSMLIADEPTTALDVTVQAQVMRQLRDLNSSYGTAILVVSHDIALLSEVCDRILIMYGGRVVEALPNRLVDVEAARHPYTRALVASVPRPDVPHGSRLAAITGAPDQLTASSRGCPFAPRCDRVMARCRTEDPELTQVGPGGHSCACWAARDGLEEHRADR